MLTQAKLEQQLSGLNIEVFCFDEIDSTNNKAAQIASLSEAPVVLVTALGQSEGRGTRGRSFSSPKNSGIYMSVAIELNQDTKESLHIITPAAAVGVAKAIKRVCGVGCGIKWVNDIYIDHNKLCGILCEHKKAGNREICIIGIGVNIYPFTVESDEYSPAFLADYCEAFDANELCADICRSVIGEIGEFPKREFLKIYRELSVVLGREVAFEQNKKCYKGVAKTIDDDGRLLVETNEGIIALSSGDVSIRVK